MKNENFKIPLIIGVSGHRDISLEHIDSLEIKVEEIYRCLIKKYTNTPIILLTPHLRAAMEKSPVPHATSNKYASLSISLNFKARFRQYKSMPADKK